jgi:hypothetical protein
MSAQLRQQTLSFTMRGQVQANKPGPRSKAPTTLPTTVSNALIYSSKRRRQVGGVNEAAAIEAFSQELTLMLANQTLEMQALDRRETDHRSCRGSDVEPSTPERRSYKLLLILRQLMSKRRELLIEK